MTIEESPKTFERMIEAPKSVFVIKKGVWLSSAEGIICSNCYHKLETTGLLSTCPNCGAKMEGKE